MFFQNFSKMFPPDITSNKPNFYDILHIKSNATEKEIKKGYRKLATQCHPDKCNGDKEKEEQFKLINEAYATFS